MNRAERHVCFAPAILKIVQRGWNPGIGKGEVFFRLEIECGLVRNKRDAAMIGGDRLIDLCVVYRMLLKFRRRARADLLHGNVVHDYLDIVLFTPRLGEYTLKPGVIAWQKMSPFRDREGLLTGECAIGESKEVPHSRCCGRQSEEMPPRDFLSFGLWRSHDLETLQPRQTSACRG